MEFSNIHSEHFVSLFKPSFFAASGMLPLSLFIHNIIITLMRNNRNQEHNVRNKLLIIFKNIECYLMTILCFFPRFTRTLFQSRDLSIAYILVVLTYLLIGFTFYICFPLKKSCIEDVSLKFIFCEFLYVYLYPIDKLFQIYH